MRFLAVFGLILLAGCAGAGGGITENRSTFDGAVSLSMRPANVFRNNDGMSGADMAFGLLWSSKQRDQVVLVAEVYGAHSISTIRSLHFNVDGEMLSLSSIDRLTEFQSEYVRGVGVSSSSSKRYLLNRALLDRLLAAKDVRVRLDLRKAYAEGVFTDATFGAARPAFVKFVSRVDSVR